LQQGRFADAQGAGCYLDNLASCFCSAVFGLGRFAVATAESCYRLGTAGMAQTTGDVLLLVGGIVVLLCGGMLSTPGIIPTKFVVLGPFRYVRNPMSLGGVTKIFGLALFCRSISILLFSAILFLALHGIVVFWEESFLEKRYGESYLQYKHSVNRWLPAFKHGPGKL